MRPFLPGLIFGAVAPEHRCMVCHCFLVETEAGLVLVDTGLGTEDLADPGRLGGMFLRVVRPDFDHAETAIAQVRRLGYDPADVRHIVLTHLDVDHAGAMSDFPAATVHVLGDELDAAIARPTRAMRARYRAAQWAHGPKWSRYDATGESWLGFEAVRPLAGLPPEILMIPLRGHSPGHCGVAVRSDDGWRLHAGDAYFHRDEMNPYHPRCTFGLSVFQSIVQVDGTRRHHNQQRLRELGRDHGNEVHIFSAHDAVELSRCTGAAEGPRPAPRK